MKNFDFDNDTSEEIFSQPYISYRSNERLYGDEPFHSNNYLLKMPRSHDKTQLKSAPQKLKMQWQKLYQKVKHYNHLHNILRLFDVSPNIFFHHK